MGMISWVGVEHSQYPVRKGFKDYDLIDLPFPIRKMSINPIGTLKQRGKVENKSYVLERGVYTFPSVGDNVILPSEYQLQAIVENNDDNATVVIGKAALAGNFTVKINPDKLFGRHLAILGNTGSGKSCSVSGLIRWSLEAAKEKADKNCKALNARFLILDPNGEYSKSFDGIDKPVRKFKIKIEDSAQDEDTSQLKVPAWMWNSHEWINFSQAAPGAQRPLLLQALVDLKRGNTIDSSIKIRIQSFLTSRKVLLQTFLQDLPNASINYGRFLGFTDSLQKFAKDVTYYKSLIKPTDYYFNELENLYLIISKILKERISKDAEGKYRKDPKTGNYFYSAFMNQDLETIINSLNAIIVSFKSIDNLTKYNKINPDTPIKFNLDDLIPFLQQLAEAEGGNVVQFSHMLSLRMKFLVSDSRLNGTVNPETEISLVEWLNEYIGTNNSENGQISIIDLSLVPSDVTHTIVAVLSRLTFEAIQRYRRFYQRELPTVIVLEEAHTFIRDSKNDDSKYSQLCVEVFEKIAREGRKFGLSMVLSSQRPSELSPTVLSQCNTFLLHRIVNDRDQDLVKKLVPDNIGGLLKELPILPTRKAILLGWASPIPILVDLRELKEEHRPQSNDPKFWDVWVGNEQREIDWQLIANEWQNNIEVEEFLPEGESNPKTDEGGEVDLPF